jgi:hypothetical protein
MGLFLLAGQFENLCCRLFYVCTITKQDCDFRYYDIRALSLLAVEIRGNLTIFYLLCPLELKIYQTKIKMCRPYFMFKACAYFFSLHFISICKIAIAILNIRQL